MVLSSASYTSKRVRCCFGVEEEFQLQAQLVEAMLASEGLHPPMTRQLLFPRRVL
jgi:hypothetical protein